MMRYYLDTSVLVPWLLNAGPQTVIDTCVSWMERGDRGEVTLVASTLTWDEVTYVAGRAGKPRGQGVPYDVSQAARCSAAFMNLKFLQLCPVDRSAITGADQILRKVNLRPRDALHAQLALTHAGGNLVTVDSDFTRESVLRTLGLRVTRISGP